jgi:hypothetical protein
MELEELLILLKRYGVARFKSEDFELEFTEGELVEEDDFGVDFSGLKFTDVDEEDVN